MVVKTQFLKIGNLAVRGRLRTLNTFGTLAIVGPVGH